MVIMMIIFYWWINNDDLHGSDAGFELGAEYTDINRNCHCHGPFLATSHSDDDNKYQPS